MPVTHTTGYCYIQPPVREVLILDPGLSRCSVKQSPKCATYSQAVLFCALRAINFTAPIRCHVNGKPSESTIHDRTTHMAVRSWPPRKLLKPGKNPIWQLSTRALLNGGLEMKSAIVTELPKSYSDSEGWEFPSSGSRVFHRQYAHSPPNFLSGNDALNR